MNLLEHKDWSGSQAAEVSAARQGNGNGTEDNDKAQKIRHLYLEAVRKFISISRPHLVTFQSAKGSVNNVIRFVYLREIQEEICGTPQYLLRIYNNGNDLRKIQFEHLVLEKMQPFEMEFQIPIALRSSEKGETIVQLSDGNFASLFHVIPGVLPYLELTREIGRASGQLSLIFRDLTTQMTPSDLELVSTPPYFDLYKAHEAISKELFLQETASDLYSPCRQEMDTLVQKVLELEVNLDSYHQHYLPQQLIHGDLHYDNVLVLFAPASASAAVERMTGRVSAILDFEFCAMDWRAMELAICLSKYLAQPEPFNYVVDFIQGYAEGSHSTEPYLSELECAVVPSLIELRILSNVVFFVGRVRARQESAEILTGGKAGDYVGRLRWIAENRERLVALLLRAFHHPSSSP